MPILLDDLDNSLLASQSKITPKFFSSSLNGSGKKVGLLNEKLLPIKTCDLPGDDPAEDMMRKRRTTQNDITTSMIPLDPRLSSTYRNSFRKGMATTRIPDMADVFELEINSAITGQPVTGHKIFYSCHPQTMVIRENKDGGAATRQVVIHYRSQLFSMHASSTESRAMIIRGLSRIPLATTSFSPRSAQAAVTFHSSPMEEAADFIVNELPSEVQVTNLDDLDEWFANYSVFDQIQTLAEIWASDAIATEINAVIDTAQADLASGVSVQEALNPLALQLRYIENYPVSLDAYRLIHAHMVATLKPHLVSELSKQNLNLLMSDTLAQLQTVKPQLQVPGPPAVPFAMPTHYSAQQRAVITTADPLTMVQAGAGTGKSTVILERIKYLEACGVKPSDITVLSFTNAAADNIIEKNPHVHSMTIAKMIVDIYGLNFPLQKTSASESVINALEIFYPSDPVADALRAQLENVARMEVGYMTALSSFMERNFDAVMKILDHIQQTTLELQIVVCYQKIDQLTEPAHVQSRHLIIDEVQDNSIFEFVYALRYVAKHQETLFIVGDASQTLYEFRSANPSALNTLEASGVFATFQLTTNYRSKQEILDFANVGLQILDTNRIANIRLQANSLQASTEASFKDSVTLDMRLAQKLNSFVKDELGLIVRNTIAPDWVAKRIDRGERVCFLARTRHEVNTIRDALEAAFPGQEVQSLVSERITNTDVFSNYVRLYWDQALMAPPNNAAFVISEGIKNNLNSLTKYSVTPAMERAVTNMRSAWWIENRELIDSLVASVQIGAMTHAAFFERLRQTLLDFEVRKNQERMNLVKQRNNDRKQRNMGSDAKLLVSTIHGVKGLEFDHTVVVYKDVSPMTEELRRLYYVAFTRAMVSTYVLAYGNNPNSVIQNQYEQIVKALADRDAQVAQAAQLAAAQVTTPTTQSAGPTDPNAVVGMVPATDDAPAQILVTAPLDGSEHVPDPQTAVFDDDGGCLNTGAAVDDAGDHVDAVLATATAVTTAQAAASDSEADADSVDDAAASNNTVDEPTSFIV